MNKTLITTALLTLLCTTAHAADTLQPATPGKAEAPTVANPTKAPEPAPVLDCKYRIPAEKTAIEQSLISTWAGKAAVQSFDFTPATIDVQLGELKPCFTEQGWQSFNDALQKSGNINAIKTQHLTVSSQIDGTVKVNPVKDNQWKVTVPMQVVYQNDKEKLTQQLDIDLLVGRKTSGDLGIMQIIATPRQPAGAMPAVLPPTTTGQTPTGAPVNNTAPVGKSNNLPH